MVDFMMLYIGIDKFPENLSCGVTQKPYKERCQFS